MKTLIVLITAAMLAACGSAPKPPQPTGEWQPLNQPVNHGQPK